jgi:hypothetical protein
MLKFDDLTFGVELEFVAATRSQVAAAIAAAGIPVEEHFRAHQPRVNPVAWVVCPDGSVSGGEVVAPILRGQAGLEALAAVCRAMTAAGADVNKDCGMHVHVGARNVLTMGAIRNLAKMFIRHEAAFDQIVAPSRRNSANRFTQRNATAFRYDGIAGAFAKLDAARNMRDVANVMNGGFAARDVAGGGYEATERYTSHRYYSLNFQSYAAHGTVEFRQHQGTVDAQKACEWVKLVVGFVARATQIDGVKNDTTPATLDELLRKTDAAGRRFFVARAAHFAARAARAASRARRAA